ncbi:hypothetical protein NMY22_g344 [Coprinellus aureogranulatus]|nr:hypothetical protein NMY22_g344 [Coprinellus aureogranulatus]
MRPKHTQHSIPTFPVYSCAFLNDSTFILGGGGGAARSGIKNKLRLYDAAEDRSIQQLHEFELEKGEDAPMSMVAHAEIITPQTSTIVCGVNSPEDQLERGFNENCRVYSVNDNRIAPLRTKSTLSSGDLEEYQKVTVLSPDGTLLAVAGPHHLTVLSYPDLDPVVDPITTEKEIYDAAFSPGLLVVATTHSLLVYSLPEAFLETEKGKKGKGKSQKSGPSALSLVKAVDVPASIIGEGSTFRQIKINSSIPNVAYTVINTNPARSRQKKSAPRQGFVLKWNTNSWTIEKSKKIGEKGITCLDLSADGRWLAYGSSELNVGLLDASTLAPAATILKAHEFPPTVVKFNPAGSLLVSGSPDNTIRVVTVPSHINSGAGSVVFVLAIILVILAVLIQLYVKS